MWGFVTVLNDILVPHLKALFELNYTQTMLIQFTFFSAYFLMSVPSSRILARVGYQKSIVLGLAVMGLGALLFYPAAAAKSYALFLGALWVLASGITLLQVAANPYVAQLGAPAKASSRLNLAQAFNSLGTTIAPYLGGLLILSETAGQADARAVQLPYIGIALTLFLLAFGVSRFHLPSLPDIEEGHGVLAGDSIWQHRHLVLGAIGIFLYVGAEVSIGSFLVNYFSQPDIGGLTERAAAGYVSFYWGGAMVGRFIGSAVLRATPPGKVLGGAAVLASALVWISVATTGGIAMGSIIAVGLFNSVMFPTIFTLGIDQLGPLTGKGSGLMIMAIVGGAILPVLQGALADSIGIHMAFIMPAVCYLYIVYYGFSGSRVIASSASRARSCSPARPSRRRPGCAPEPHRYRPCDRRAVARPAGHRPHHEHLVQAHLAVEDVAAGDAEAALQIERRQHLPVLDDRADVRRVLLDQRDHAVGERLAQFVPRAFAQRVRRVLQEDPHDVLAGRRERRVVHRGNGHLEQRALARGGRTWRRPRRARRIRCWGRCAWSRGAAGRARRGRRVNSGRPLSARLILQLVPSMRKLRMARDELGGRGRCSSSRRRNVSLGSRLDATAAASISSPFSSTTPRARPSRTSTLRDRRVRADLDALGARRSGDGFRDRAHAAAHEAPQPAMSGHAAHAVMQQDVGRAGRARAAVGADHAVGGQRDLHLLAIRTTRPENPPRSA